MIRVTRGNSVLVLIDVQERLVPVISGTEELLRRLEVLVQAATVLEITIVATEQYPRGLGATVSPLRELLQGVSIVEKTRFSCCGVDAFETRISETSREVVMVAGMEAHVCVQQTVLDLVSGGTPTVVLADCVGSRHELDREHALARMVRAGAEIVTLEAALFEMLEDAGSERFKPISRLVRTL
jgi:nicotinamidase-related amidase